MSALSPNHPVYIVVDLLLQVKWADIFSAVLGGAVAIFFIILKKRVEEGRQKGIEAPGTQPLLKHPFFQSSRYLIMDQIVGVELIDPVRTRMFRDMLSIKVGVCTQKVREFISSDYVYTNSEDFFSSLCQLQSSSIEEYEAEWRRTGVLEEAIEEFGNWREERENLVRMDYVFISYSLYYKDFEAKKLAFLDKQNGYLVSAVMDTEQVFRYLNGAITGKLYKGMPFPPLGPEVPYPTEVIDRKNKKGK